ncbi:MAG TPA: hypothetical protein VH309_03625, partial [Elusimicrobiota bacterium]|nr:hypothetical protein [Elusimicrobiota bacterium]
DAAAWARAQPAGARLEPATCLLLAADGHALTRREVEALKAGPAPAGGKSKEKDAKGLDGARAAAAGAAKGGVAGTYGDSKKLFDGAAAGGGADAAVDGRSGSAALPAVARFSSALNADVRNKYAEEDAGRRLLAHFTSADGTTRLPGVTLADLGGGAAAVYDRPSGLIVFDRGEAAQAALSTAPPDQRAALARRFADPDKLAAYLADHAPARAALVDRDAETLFHETFHAWQQRRDPNVDAVEGRDPVEWELEAYREELHFFHERVMRDPSLSDRSEDMDMYRRLLSGYPEFKETVMELYPDGNGRADFPTVEGLLARRAQAGRPGAAGSLAVLRGVDADYQGREADFASRVLPGMQKEAYPLLISRELAAGRPAAALALAAEAPDGIRKANGPAPFAAVESFLRSAPSASSASRLEAWDAYLAYQTKATGSNVLPADLFAIYQRDRRAAVQTRLEEAAKTSGQPRLDALAWAKSYASGLPDEAALLKRIDAAGKVAAR